MDAGADTKPAPVAGNKPGNKPAAADTRAADNPTRRRCLDDPAPHNPAEPPSRPAPHKPGEPPSRPVPHKPAEPPSRPVPHKLVEPPSRQVPHNLAEPPSRPPHRHGRVP